MIFRDSPEKHLYSDAVVWLAAIIRGLLFPLILTSIVGMDNKLAFTSFVSSFVCFQSIVDRLAGL